MPQGRGARLSLVHVRPTLHFFSWATAASAAWKPILLWVPSQKGLVTDAPHRHNANLGPRPLISTLLPLTSSISSSPSTRYGPLGRMLIFTAMETPPHKIRSRAHHSMAPTGRALSDVVSGRPMSGSPANF